MSKTSQSNGGSWWRAPLSYLNARLQEHEDQVFLVVALVIGALSGLAAFLACSLGRCWGVRSEQVQALLPVGAASAVAAAFNTPLSAVLFSLEEIVGDLHAPVLGSVVLASATSWMVLRRLLGNNPLFKVPQYQLVHPAEFAIYAVLGVTGGLVSVAFTKFLLAMRAL